MYRFKCFQIGMVGTILVVSAALAACCDRGTPTSTGTPVPASPMPAGMDVVVPRGNQPTLDGVLTVNEWSDARLELFSDGSELYLKHHGGYLYLGIRAGEPGMIVGNIFVNHGDRVLILHSSAALGTAIYEKSADGFQQIQDFIWRCRNPGNSPSAQAERDAFLQQEGWVADISYMGTPQELEYKIAMPDRSLRLAVTFTPASNISERIFWPVSLADDCIIAPQGGFPIVMKFSPSTWVIVTAE